MDVQVTSNPDDLISFLKNLLINKRRDKSPRLGGEPPHTDPKCNCDACRLSRYEVPLALQGEALNDEIVLALKAIISNGEHRAKAGVETSTELAMKPLSPEAERAVMQYRVDSVAACARAERALSALLPEDRRPPEDVLTTEMTIEQALELLQKGRAIVLEKLAQRKAAADAERVIREGLAEAAAPTPAAPTAE